MQDNQTLDKWEESLEEVLLELKSAKRKSLVFNHVNHKRIFVKIF